MSRIPSLILVAALGSACASHAPSVPAATTTHLPPPSMTLPAAVARAEPLSAHVDALFSVLNRSPGPGCSVGIYRAGKVVLARAYGLSNLESPVPLGTDSVFDVASISKQFTALAVLLLEHEGKLSLDDDIRRYVPEIPDYGRPIRIRHLLHHTGGLREYNDLLSLAGRDNDRVTDEDIVRLLQMQKAPNFAAGTRFEYSNMGYAVLGVLVKRVSQMPFSAFAKQRIFDPLGMKNTRVLDDHHAVVPHRATGYNARTEGGYTTAVSRWEHAGPSRVGTTIDDLAEWDANFYAPRVGDATILNELRTPGTLDDGTALPYGAGLFLETRDGRRVEEHSGQTGGYLSELIRYPDEQLTIACLCNVEGVPEANPYTLTESLSALVLPPLSVDTRDAGASPPVAKLTYAAVDADFDEVVGAWYDPLTFDVRTVRREGDHAVMAYALEPGGRSAVLALEGRRSLIAPTTRTRYRFEPATRHSPAHLVRTFGHDPDISFVHFEPLAPERATLAEYIGRYRSEEVARDVELSVVDGKLRMATWGHALDAEPFSALTRDIFALGEGGVLFERDAPGHIRGFSASSHGYHGVMFVKERPEATAR